MADAVNSDVERHYWDLQAQLQEDGLFDADSQVSKTMKRLQRALKEDGFSFSGPQDSVNVKKNNKPNVEVEAAVSSPVEETTEYVAIAPALEEEEPVVRAFRTKNEFDASVVESVFAAIDGWKTKIIQHKGSHFVIASNAKRLTDNRVKQALVSYVTELKQVEKTV